MKVTFPIVHFPYVLSEHHTKCELDNLHCDKNLGIIEQVDLNLTCPQQVVSDGLHGDNRMQNLRYKKDTCEFVKFLSQPHMQNTTSGSFKTFIIKRTLLVWLFLKLCMVHLKTPF
jgi:hypothetical protein